MAKTTKKEKSPVPDMVIRIIAVEKAVKETNKRIDRIIAAYNKSKPLKGLWLGVEEIEYPINLQPIKSAIAEVKEIVDALKVDIATMKTDVSQIKEDVRPKVEPI